MSLRALAAATAAINVIAAALSVRQRMPAEFGKPLLGRLAVVGDRRHVLRDFLTWKGTAIAPPLPMVVGLAVLGSAAPGSGAARAAMGALGAGGVLGHLGEPFTWRVLAGRAPRGASALVLLSIALYAAIARSAWRLRVTVEAA